MEKEQDQKERKVQAQHLPQRDSGAGDAYFVSIYTYQRRPCFKTPALAEILKQQWQELPQRFRDISLDHFGVMPDQLRFIVWINAHVPSAPTLPQIVGAYKSLCAVAWLHRLNETGSEVNGKIWQKGYDNRIIRDKEELERMRRYIENNPIVG